LGELSFTDESVSFNKGMPSSAEKYRKPDQVLGPPDYVNDYQEPPGYVTLGCGRTLIVRFLDNALVDVDGPDLYVFEIGPDIESTEILISKNRASAVRDYLLTIEELKNFEMEINGYGESRPIATNDTEEGREKNRRVEILIIPQSKQ